MSRPPLDPAQRAAAETEAPRVLVRAGPGSGKTATLVHRVAHLVGHRGVAPGGILLLTFSHRAARELRARTAAALGHVHDAVRVGTFHAAALDALRTHGSAIGLPAELSVLAPGEARMLVGQALHRAGFASSELGPDRALRLLGLAAADEQPLDAVVAERAPELHHRAPALKRADSAYRAAKAELGRVDFDDLLVLWRALLDPETAHGSVLRARFAHVLVDEYQDTTSIQAGLAEDLATGGHLFVVGDEAQSIYRFRGTRVENLRAFPTWAPTRVFHLPTSHRCPPPVIAVADAVVAGRGWSPPLRSSLPDGPAALRTDAETDEDEAAAVATAIRQLAEAGVALEAQAVLIRSHRDAMPIELSLQQDGLPYSVRGGTRWIDRDHVQWALDHLRLTLRPSDPMVWARLLGAVRGVGPATLSRLGPSLAAPGPDDAPSRLRRAAASAELPATAASGVAELAARLERLGGDPLALGLGPGLTEWADAAPGHDRATIAADFARLGELGSLDAVLNGLDSPDTRDRPRGVVVSTVHAAKGLEWDAVHVVGLADGRFPVAAALGSDVDEDEERRLFYVAVTRARRHLRLYVPEATVSDGAIRPLMPSRLLDRLPVTPARAPRRRPRGAP